MDGFKIGDGTITLSHVYDAGGNDVSASATFTLDPESVEVQWVVRLTCTFDLTVNGVDFSGLTSDMDSDPYGGSGFFMTNVQGGDALPEIDAYGTTLFVSNGTLDKIPTVGDYQLENGSVICVFKGVDKSPGFQMYPPPEASGKARDFVVALDVVSSSAELWLDGVKGVADDTFALKKGRNMVYVTEPVDGSLYASRCLVEKGA